MEFASDGNVTAQGAKLRDQLRVIIDDGAIVRVLGACLDPVLADLIEFAVAVYTADRLCKRGPDSLTWSRSLSVQVPVRRVALWEASVDELKRVLQFLTGDTWQFQFTKRTGSMRHSEEQTSLPIPAIRHPSCAILFSGGLDSLAGLASAAGGSEYEELLAVSGLTNTRIGATQAATLQPLRERLPGKLLHLGIRIRFIGRAKKAFDREEHSQRTRGFLFQPLGAAAALAAGVSVLAVPENGIGAINLPYLDSQFGTQAGRAANPVMLGLMSSFIRRVSGRDFEITLPHLLQTKSELLRTHQLEKAAAITVSCDSFPLRHPTQLQCGLCTSCLLRRQSMRGAALGAWDRGKPYTHDVFAPGNDPSDGAWFQLRAMGEQVENLEGALSDPDARSALSIAFPALAEQFALLEGKGEAATISSLIDLYRRYCDEWRDFGRAYANAA